MSLGETSQVKSDEILKFEGKTKRIRKVQFDEIEMSRLMRDSYSHILSSPHPQIYEKNM